MKLTVTNVPDFTGISFIYQEEIRIGLLDVARFAIRDAIAKIQLRKTPSGGTQKANSPAYARWKIKHRGHDVPLKKDNVLSDFGQYNINGQPATATATKVWTGDGRAEVIAQLPDSRGAIVRRLRGMGYQYFDLSPETVAYETKRMRDALAQARAAFARRRR